MVLQQYGKKIVFLTHWQILLITLVKLGGHIQISQMLSYIRFLEACASLVMGA